jgi:transposase
MARNGLKKTRFLKELLTARSITQAAELAGVGLRTATTWLAAADFRAALVKAQDDTFSQTTRQTVAYMADALETLRALMQDKNTPATARVAACRVILESGVKFTELVDVLQRLDALERRGK